MAMGRHRTIRTEVHGNVVIASLPDLAWRVFFGLYPLVDDEGRTPADPAFVAGQIFWASSRQLDEVQGALAELDARSLVKLYTVASVKYLAIIGWRDKQAVTYQRIDKPQPAKFPGPDDSSNGSASDSSNGSQNDSTGQVALIPSGIGSGSGSEGIGATASKLASVAVATINEVRGKGRYRPDSEVTLKLCRTLARAKISPDQLPAAIRHIAVPWLGTKYEKSIRPATVLQLDRVRAALDDIEAGNGAATTRLAIADGPRTIRFDDGTTVEVSP